MTDIYLTIRLHVKLNCWEFILFIVILQYIIRQHNNNRVDVYRNMFRLRRVIIRLII